MSEGQARRRTNDPDGMRRKLLDVAASSFQSAGYHATGMHDIMREAGVTGGALYHHFPTKKALALAVIRERVAEIVAATWIAPVEAAPSAAEGILAVFAEIAAELEAKARVSGCPLNNLAIELVLADPDFRAAADSIFSDWRHAIARRLEADGEPDAEAVATFVVASYSGAMALAKAAQDPAPLRACAAQLARVLGPATGRAAP